MGEEEQKVEVQGEAENQEALSAENSQAESEASAEVASEPTDESNGEVVA